MCVYRLIKNNSCLFMRRMLSVFVALNTQLLSVSPAAFNPRYSVYACCTHTVDPHLSGLHLSDSLDYPDTTFSRDSHLHVSFLALVVYNSRCTCVLSQQKMATPS